MLKVAGASTDEVGGMNTFELARQCVRPNAIVAVVALYDEAYELFENKRDGVIKVAMEC